MDNLDTLLIGAVRNGIREPGLAYQLPAIDRVWQASRCHLQPVKLRRHPNLFLDLLPGVEETFEARRSRSASRGWQAKLPSRKLQRTVRARSLLEQRAMERCEVDGDIVRYCEQPITLTYVDREGVQRKHTPDLYYETATICSFVEVKWEAEARKPTNEARWPAIAAVINGMGFRYEVLTERHILRRPAADNVAELLRFRRADTMPFAAREAVRGVLRHGPASIAEITTLVPGTTTASLCRGIVDGWLCVDLNVRIGPSSALRLPSVRGLTR